jgi:acyl-coenzyme A thioesterase PaaI-like protein
LITVEFKLNFLAPAGGDRLRVCAEVLKGGRSLYVTEAHAYAIAPEGETRCASALVTYFVLPPRKKHGQKHDP